MKPVRLTINLFGSYSRKTIIDFTKPEQNLFLITGDTGSGKSTIFDAIVFALYGETGSNTDSRDGKELQSQFSDGKEETFVELVFTERHGTEISEYTLKRCPKQARKGRKNDISEKITLLLPDGTALSQKEADARLSEILVLTKSQFMQVSMIAQGEFMEFLKASSNEKKKILRKLFGTEIFEKIVVELKNRRKLASEQIKMIQNICQTEAAHIIIPENYENTGFMNRLKNNFLAGEISACRLENLVEYLGKFCREMDKRKISAERNYNRILKDSVEKRDRLKDAYSLLESFGEMDRAKKELAECEKAEPLIRQKNDLIQKIDAAYEIQAVYNRYADISVTADDVRKKLDYQKSLFPELSDRYAVLEKETEKALSVKNSTETDFVKTAERVKNNLETFGKIARAEKDISAKKPEISANEKHKENIRNKISVLEKNIADCQKTAERLAGAEKLMIEWNVRNDETRRICDDYKAVLEINDEIILRRKKTEKLRQEYIAARQEYTLKMTEYTEKRTAFLDAQAGFIAREKLRDGQPCPVCGSLEHPAPCRLSEAHSSITREMIDRLTKEVSVLDAAQNEKSAQTSSALEVLSEREKNLDNALKNLHDSMAVIIDDVPENTDMEQVREILTVWQSRLKEEGKILSENVAECRKASEMSVKYTSEKDKLVTELEKTDNRLSELKSEIAVSELLQKELAENLFYPDEVTAHKALTAAESLKNQKTTLYNDIKNKLDSVRSNLERTETLLRKYSEELPELEKNLADRRSDYMTVTEKYSLDEWQSITEKFRKDHTEILRKEIEAHNQRKLSAHTAYVLSEKAVGNNVRPDTAALEKEYISATEALETAQKNLDTCREVCKSDNSTYELLSAQTAGYSKLSADYENLNRLCGRLSGTASGEHISIETFVQRYYLQRILDSANVHFRRMSGEQYELRLIDENQAVTGRTDRGLDFMVYSTVADSEREIKTLSGGEKFMAALSLALGMSGRIQENTAAVNPDIMFIDEGFGSLDENSRNQAVKVLKEMAEDNQFIGIISHVTEMKQEIDNQLIVTKDRNGSHVRWVIN